MAQRMQRPGIGNRDRGMTARDRVRLSELEPTKSGLRSPELRIVRRVNYGNQEEKKTWNEYLDDLGEKNYGKGDPKRLSTMGCTLVTATAINLGFQNKYGEDIFQNRKKVLQSMRRLASSFNDHVAGEDSLGFGFMLDVTLAEVGVEFTDSRAAREDEQPRNPQAQFLSGWSEEEGAAILARQEATKNMSRVLWTPGEFAVHQLLNKVSDKKYAVSLATNDSLYSERKEIMDYLINTEGFNPNDINPERRPFQPHMTVFKSFGNVTIDTAIPPPSISFHPPRAIINENS